VDDGQLLKGAIDGMLNHLDPYCAYFDNKEYEQFSKRTKGQFYGIGVEVTRLPGEGLLIVTPIEGSPAFQVGLRSGDRIIRIDGAKTDNIPLPKGVEMISGKPGTSVRLTLFRPSTEETFERSVTRGLVTVRTVRGWARDADWDWDYLIDPKQRIGYVRISSFEGQTEEQFDQVVGDLLARHKMRGLVLDLRDNPGGLMPVVVNIANRFIKEGRIVSTKRRVGPEQAYMATGENNYPNVAMAVLITAARPAPRRSWPAACGPRPGHAVGERSFGKQRAGADRAGERQRGRQADHGLLLPAERRAHSRARRGPAQGGGPDA